MSLKDDREKIEALIDEICLEEEAFREKVESGLVFPPGRIESAFETALSAFKNTGGRLIIFSSGPSLTGSGALEKVEPDSGENSDLYKPKVFFFLSKNFLFSSVLTSESLLHNYGKKYERRKNLC